MSDQGSLFEITDFAPPTPDWADYQIEKGQNQP